MVKLCTLKTLFEAGAATIWVAVAVVTLTLALVAPPTEAVKRVTGKYTPPKRKELLEKDLIIQREINEKITLKTQIETNEIIYNLKLELASKK